MQFRIAVAVVGIAIAGAATAQNDQNQGLSTGVAVAPDGEAIGSTYTEETFGDWEKRCVRTQDGNDPCQMYQLITDTNGGSVAEMTIFPVPGNDQIVAGATVITPLETLLTEAVTISIDGGQARRYPFTFCTVQGCVARIGLTNADLDAYRGGAAAQVRIVPAVAPDQEVRVDASLSGFTAAYEAITP
ncbi:MAG: invasion associated locus B family protein [Pseudomonadota bacterium]